jgi:DNA-binding NarL/FixJ family response regulator
MQRALTILHIDDDSDTRFLLRELISESPETEGGEHTEICWLDASGVEEAVAQFAGAPLDAILLDNRLAGENGVELLPRIRQVWGCKVWILTGFFHEKLHDESLQRGAAGVIGKDELLKDVAGLRAFLLQNCRRSSPQ